jgi:hypothetical protein
MPTTSANSFCHDSRFDSTVETENKKFDSQPSAGGVFRIRQGGSLLASF